jgi:hypothetical protein
MDLSLAGKTIGVSASSMDMEGMSYEDAHSDGYVGGLFRLHIIDTAFGTRAGSSEPGGSGTGGGVVSCYASFGGDARCSQRSCCPRRSRTACCPGGAACSSYAGMGERILTDAIHALGRWAGRGLL